MSNSDAERIAAEEARRMRVPLWADFLIPAAILGILTAVFHFTDLDLAISGRFHTVEKGWFLGDSAFFQFLYKRALMPAIYVTGISVLLLLAGLHYHTLRRLRKIALYLILVAIIGPGFLVNAVLKEGWGRPRPRNVEEFGGKDRYEQVWEYDASSPGKSFPSGHASMGFYFFGAWFLTRRWGWGWWWGTLVGTLLLGLALGLARIVQGGHFASDVLWSAGVCYFTSAGLFYGMRMHRNLFLETPRGEVSKWRLLWIGVGVVVVSILAVSFPNHDEKRQSPESPVPGARISVTLMKGDGVIRVGDDGGGFLFTADVEGFGLPGTQIIDTLRVKTEESPPVIEFKQRMRAWFIGWEQPFQLEVPADAPVVEIEVGRGDLVIDLSGAKPGTRWKIATGKGDVLLRVPEALALKIEGRELDGEPEISAAGFERDGNAPLWKRGVGDKVAVEVRVAGGRLTIAAPG